jgi:hypothetical protein
MMEQFSEALPSELELWIVDQKCKTIDDGAHAANQFVASRSYLVLGHSYHKTQGLSLSEYICGIGCWIQ